MRLGMRRVAAMARSITMFLVVAPGIALQAQYVQDIVPKCAFAGLGDYRIWSPDCHSYIVHKRLRRTLNEELFVNGPQGDPSIPIVFTTPPTAGERWKISERGTQFVAHDPTENVRCEAVLHHPGCWLMNIRGTRWLDSERILLMATVSCTRGEVHQLQYAVVAKSGKILLAPKPWPYLRNADLIFLEQLFRRGSRDQCAHPICELAHWPADEMPSCAEIAYAPEVVASQWNQLASGRERRGHGGNDRDSKT
jgi:hypothetical protein